VKASSTGSPLTSDKQPNPAVTEIIEVPEPFANAMRIGDCYSAAAPSRLRSQPRCPQEDGQVGP
jgi:hypothetical protein